MARLLHSGKMEAPMLTRTLALLLAFAATGCGVDDTTTEGRSDPSAKAETADAPCPCYCFPEEILSELLVKHYVNDVAYLWVEWLTAKPGCESDWCNREAYSVGRREPSCESYTNRRDECVGYRRFGSNLPQGLVEEIIYCG